MHLSLRSPRQPWSTDNVIVPAFISSPATYFSCHHFLCSPQMLASRLTAYFRKKCVVVTDLRVRLMNEILVCMKFIKMYCWENAFAQNIHSEWLLYPQMTQQYHSTLLISCLWSFRSGLGSFLEMQTSSRLVGAFLGFLSPICSE